MRSNEQVSRMLGLSLDDFYLPEIEALNWVASEGGRFCVFPSCFPSLKSVLARECLLLYISWDKSCQQATIPINAGGGGSRKQMNAMVTANSTDEHLSGEAKQGLTK
jgi:hypothetical protein